MSRVQRWSLLHEGKAKQVFSTNVDGLVWLDCTDVFCGDLGNIRETCRELRARVLGEAFNA